jgi:hypothetical protein
MSSLLWLFSYGSLIYIQNFLTGHLVLAKLKTASIKKKSRLALSRDTSQGDLCQWNFYKSPWNLQVPPYQDNFVQGLDQRLKLIGSVGFEMYGCT